MTAARPAAASTRLPKWAWAVVLVRASPAVLYVGLRGRRSIQPRETDRPLFLALNDAPRLDPRQPRQPVFVIFFGIPRVVIDTLIESLTGALHAIGWPALVAIAGSLGLLVGGWRFAAGAALGFWRLGILGLWTSSVDTLGAIAAAVAISFAIGVPLGILAGAERSGPPLPHADPRRDADHADVRLPGAVRAVLRDRAGGGGDRDAHLRDAGGHPDHGARHPPRARPDTVEAGALARGDRSADADEGPAPAGRRGARRWRSTRRSCWPSR